MALKPGKRDIQALARMMDQDWDSLDDAAEAVLAKAWELYEAKAKYTVVGQLYYAKGYVDPDEARAAKVALGNYSTERQARQAAESLWYSTQTHEEFRSWVLPVHHGTPASFYADRKKAREEAEREARRDENSPLETFLRESREGAGEPRVREDGASVPEAEHGEGAAESSAA